MGIFDKIFKKNVDAVSKENAKALKLEGVTKETLEEVSDNKGDDE